MKFIAFVNIDLFDIKYWVYFFVDRFYNTNVKR